VFKKYLYFLHLYFNFTLILNYPNSIISGTEIYFTDLVKVGCEGADVEGEPAFEEVFRFGSGVDDRVAVGGEGGCVWVSAQCPEI
jgi:hypothetical protein